MQESKRQLQVAQLINEELSKIFIKERLTMIHGGLVSISKVQVTPDLLEARVHLSLFKIESPEQAIHIFHEKTPEIRKQLGNALRHNLRRIPILSFHLDDTLEHVFKMENLINSVKPKDDPEQDSNQ